MSASQPCACGPLREWCGIPGRCERCGARTDILTEGELDELLEVFGPSLRLTALVAEVREYRRKEST